MLIKDSLNAIVARYSACSGKLSMVLYNINQMQDIKLMCSFPVLFGAGNECARKRTR